jgi:RND family efflux transporter MFP subunit
VNAQPELDRPPVSTLTREPPHLIGTAVDTAWQARRRRQWILIGVGVVLAIAAIAWAATAFKGSPAPVAAGAGPANDSLPLVSVMIPVAASVTSTVNFTGAIHARHDMPISVEGEGGRVIAIYVEAGDTVRRGQLLARLDQSVILPQVNRLAASLEEARAQAALSLAEYGRARGVEAAGALSREEIERRRAASVTDEARVKVAEAQLAEARARLERTDIRAPADGIVLTRNVEVGQTVSPASEPLFRLARRGEVEMRGQVAEQDMPKLRVGQPATAHLTGVADPFAGEVHLLGAVIDPQTRLGEIRISLPSDPRLRPGAFARGRVVIGEANSPVLPQTAVMSDSRGTYVYVVNGENRVERRDVTVGDASVRGIVVTSGLEGGERVVATAGGFLREGEQVNVAEPKTDVDAATARQNAAQP